MRPTRIKSLLVASVLASSATVAHAQVVRRPLAMAVEENVVLDLETAQAVFEIVQVVVVSRLKSPREGGVSGTHPSDDGTGIGRSGQAAAGLIVRQTSASMSLHCGF